MMLPRSKDWLILLLLVIIVRMKQFGEFRDGLLIINCCVSQGGDVWVINPPGEGLGFILADQGYDVWIANYRATKFSYGHINYTSNDKVIKLHANRFISRSLVHFVAHADLTINLSID